MPGFGGYGKTDGERTAPVEQRQSPEDWIKERMLRVSPAQPPQAPKTAEVHIGSEYTDKGRLTPCVYVRCVQSGDWLGPIWGDEEKSVKCALAFLGEQCGCGNGWHQEVDRRVDQAPHREVAPADINFGTEWTDAGRLLGCVWVCCTPGQNCVGPLWGASEASAWRGIAELNQSCHCGSKLHVEKRRFFETGPFRDAPPPPPPKAKKPRPPKKQNYPRYAVRNPAPE